MISRRSASGAVATAGLGRFSAPRAARVIETAPPSWTLQRRAAKRLTPRKSTKIFIFGDRRKVRSYGRMNADWRRPSAVPGRRAGGRRVRRPRNDLADPLLGHGRFRGDQPIAASAPGARQRPPPAGFARDGADSGGGRRKQCGDGHSGAPEATRTDTKADNSEFRKSFFVDSILQTSRRAAESLVQDSASPLTSSFGPRPPGRESRMTGMVAAAVASFTPWKKKSARRFTVARFHTRNRPRLIRLAALVVRSRARPLRGPWAYRRRAY
jgi:hypothetical protein